jgi:hypothetical protein
VSVHGNAVRLGRFGAWINPVYGDLDAGADHVGVQVLTDTADPMPGYRKLAEALF